MKIAPRNAEAFARSPDPALRAILVYGPDAGLVRERVEALVEAVAEDPADPFRVSELGAREIVEDPARLGDEAAALSLSGGRRAVRLRQAGDDLAPHFKDFFATGRGEALVVVEAGDLPARSALRKIFEGAGAGAALACYRDDARSLPALIRETLGGFGLEATPDALAYLSANLGGDRQLSRRELEKLALYMDAHDGGGQVGGGQDKGAQNTGAAGARVELRDAEACVGDSAALSLEDLAFAVAGGEPAGAERALQRSLQEGGHPVGALGAVARHFQRLHLVRGRTARGETLEGSVKGLRPPVFWKRAESFKAQATAWPPAALARALERLLEAEAACKQSGAVPETICARTLLKIAVNAPRRRQRRSG
jgi:DNA polymerase-3 subunit delta